MTTPTQQQIIDDALMAGAVYISTRNVINQIPTPSGWIAGNEQPGSANSRGQSDLFSSH